MIQYNQAHMEELFMEKNLTTGSVFKTVVQFSFPYLLSYFLQTLYGMADLFIIGQFNGVESTTAVSIGSQVMHMLTVDCRACYGCDSNDWPRHWSTEAGTSRTRYWQHHYLVYGHFCPQNQNSAAGAFHTLRRNFLISAGRFT